jgi:hypothetical protein
MARLSKPARAFLREVVSHYLESHDFNGIPFEHLVHRRTGDAINIVADLVQRGLVEVSSGNWDNPHIKRLPLPQVQDQLAALRTGNFVCLYPSIKCMRRAIPRNLHRTKPFTRLLALGHPQLEPMFFELSVLRRYQSDPRYSFEFWGLDGNISLTEEYYRSREVPSADKILIQTFGLASNAKRERLVTVFLRYLSTLSARHQGHWSSHRIRQRGCKVEFNYGRRSIFGEFTDGISVYTALLDEIARINKLCDAIGWPHLFRQDFSDEPPKGFGLLMNTTKQEYLNFAHLLDKIISENLDYDFFDAQNIAPMEGNNTRKGSLRRLEEWLQRDIHIEGENGAATILAPLRAARKARQPTAHSVVIDEFSPKYQRLKEELVTNVYVAIWNVRLLIQTHPRAAGFETHREPDPGDIVVY